MAFDIDPFTQVYNAIWSAMTDRASFQAMVKVGNQIDLTGRGGKSPKQSLQSADAPQVRLVPGGGNHRQTNEGWQGIAKYNIELFSGDLEIDRFYYPLKWEIYKAMWVPVSAKNPFGLNFVSAVRMEDIAEANDSLEISGGSQGWFGLVTVVCELYIQRALLEE